MRVGNGFDVHKLVEGRKLILGGVDIPYKKGLLGHSDADVLIHAIMDALLGAAALGDIGKHFPDTDDKYKGISSIELLKHVRRLIQENNFIIENYKKYSKQELCEHFKVSMSSIMHKFQRLGITEKSIMGKSYKWSDKEIEYLKENWLYKEDVEIWHELGIDKTGFSHYVVQRKRKQFYLFSIIQIYQM